MAFARLLRQSFAFLALALGAAPLAITPPAAAEVRQDTIRSIFVEGNVRIEPATILSYLTVGPGDPFDPAMIDTSLKVLFATGLFADVRFERRGDILVVVVRENPIINRVVFEGNRSVSEDRLSEEIQAQPRAIFTRARVQTDVQRMVQIYRQTGRFAATITPKIVEQRDNRVDLIFEISEGPVTGVRAINFIGNRDFSDRKLRGEVLTTESKFWRIFSANDNYDPDRLEFDRELLRQFYTDRGYADFSVLSAVAELTPDQEDFFITFTIDEGERYRFGETTVSTELDTLNEDRLRAILPIREGSIYRASRIEDAVDSLTFAAGAAGYAFVQVRPNIRRDRQNRVINVEFELREGPRAYVERIDIVGNTQTVDRVIRREMQLVEGDAFNRVLVNRSRNRVRALGFFRDVEVTELPGSQPDRIVLQTEVQEQPTGELAFSAGFSSVDNFLFDVSVTQRNLRGRGQFLRLRLQTSSTRQTYDLRFTEPRFMGRNLAAGIELFSVTQDFLDEAGFRTTSAGGSLRLGFPVSENASLSLRYTARSDDVELVDGLVLNSLEEEEGARFISQVGYTLSLDRRNNPISPTRGFVLGLSQDLAGVGGDVKYLRTVVNGEVYRGLLPDVVASLAGNVGYIAEYGGDEVRRTDRFFRGGSSFRGFDTLGIGPRVVQVDDDGNVVNNNGNALGGQLFAIGTAEVSFPLGLPEQYGIAGSLFTEFGTLGIVDDSNLTVAEGFELRDDLSLRASAGVSIFWESPFGPIRFDFSEILASEEFDRTETFRFSTSTRF